MSPEPSSVEARCRLVRVVLDNLRRLLVCAILALLLAGVWRLPGWIEAQVTREANATRDTAKTLVADTRKDVLQAVADTRKDLLGEVANLRQDVMQRVDDGLDKADGQFTAISGKLDSQLTTANSTLSTTLGSATTSLLAVNTGLQPILQHTGRITAQVDDSLPMFLDCDHNVDCMFNRYVGVAKSAESAARDMSAMSNALSKDLPTYLETWREIGGNSDKATAASARMMENFARATKPLPVWLRIPLSITGAIAPTAAGAISAAAATGAFK